MGNWMVLFAWLAAQSQGVTTVDASMFEVADGRTEYCRNFDGHDVDLSTVALLKNTTFDLRPYGVDAIIEIDGDVVRFTGTPGSSFPSFSQDMRYNTLKGESVDVDLSIALYGRRPLLHWKETFKHKEARLGLMEIPPDGAPLRPFCMGGPTVTLSH